jgi:hypothetical protein
MVANLYLIYTNTLNGNLLYYNELCRNKKASSQRLFVGMIGTAMKKDREQLHCVLISFNHIVNSEEDDTDVEKQAPVFEVPDIITNSFKHLSQIFGSTAVA